jgi:hypothetical protein
MSIAAASSAVTVVVLFTLLAVYPIPILSPAFVAVGFPLAYPILEVAPDSLVRAVAPQGGPEAVAWAVALGTFLAWFVVFFGLWFVVLGRMRSNRAPP